MTNELDRTLAAQRAPYSGFYDSVLCELACELGDYAARVDRRYRRHPPTVRSVRQLAFVDQLTEACAAQCRIDLAPDLFRRQRGELLQRSRFRLQPDVEPKRVNANGKLSTANWLAFCRACGQVSAHCP
jgi:hypothetical protein